VAERHAKQPCKGWVYYINPRHVSLFCNKCKSYHTRNLPEDGFVDCPLCKDKSSINSSHIQRDRHPYIIWSFEDFFADKNYHATFSAIPCTSQTTFNGLPTVVPINPTIANGLDKKSYALIHQISTVNGSCFRDANGNWIKRNGQLGKEDTQYIGQRLSYYLGINDTCDEFLKQNASKEFLKQVFDSLPENERDDALNHLIGDS